MTQRIGFSLPAVINPSRSYVKPVAVVLALVAFGYLLFRVAKPLIGRILSGDPKKLLREGIEHYNKKLYNEAIQKFTLALECKLDQKLRVHILRYRGNSYYNTQQYAKAIEDYSGALECNPDQKLRMHVLRNRGNAYYNAQQYAKAIEDYSEALGCEVDQSNEAKMRAYRCINYLYIGKSEESEADLIRMLQCKPGQALLREFYFHRGQIYAKKGEHALAIENYDKALENTQSDAQPGNFGRILIRVEKEKSIQALNPGQLNSESSSESDSSQ